MKKVSFVLFVMVFSVVSCREHKEFFDDRVDYSFRSLAYDISDIVFEQNPDAMFDLDGDGTSGLYFSEITRLTNLQSYWGRENMRTIIDESYPEGVFSEGRWYSCIPCQEIRGSYDREKKEINLTYEFFPPMYYGTIFSVSGGIVEEDGKRVFESWPADMFINTGILESEYYSIVFFQEDNQPFLRVEAVFYDYATESLVEGTLLFTFSLVREERDGEIQ